MNPVTIDRQIECAKRELGMRKRLYPKWVKNERMTQKDADDEIAAMEAINPYAVIVATGSQPIIPDIPGVQQENVFTINEILEGEVKLERKTVAVIGSGLTGLETAEKLAKDGNRILVVEMLEEIGPGAYHQNLDDVLGRLKESRPEFITSHKLVEIREGEIVLEYVKSGRRVTRQVDAVVLAVGVKSDDFQAREMKKRFPRVLVIGDARQPGRIYNAVREWIRPYWTACA